MFDILQNWTPDTTLEELLREDAVLQPSELEPLPEYALLGRRQPSEKVAVALWVVGTANCWLHIEQNSQSLSVEIMQSRPVNTVPGATQPASQASPPSAASPKPTSRLRAFCSCIGTGVLRSANVLNPYGSIGDAIQRVMEWFQPFWS